MKIFKILSLVLLVSCITNNAYAKRGWELENHFYQPANCPFEITEVVSEWVSPYYIKCEVRFDVPEEENGGKEFYAVKYKVWHFNIFDESLGVYTGYAYEGRYRTGKSYSPSWHSYVNLGGSLQRTYVVPFQVRFADGEMWHADKDDVHNWFLENVDWYEFDKETMFDDSTDEQLKSLIESMFSQV